MFNLEMFSYHSQYVSLYLHNEETNVVKFGISCMNIIISIFSKCFRFWCSMPGTSESIQMLIPVAQM